MQSSRLFICEYCQSGYHEHCSESRTFKRFGFCRCPIEACQHEQLGNFIFDNSVVFRRIIKK